MCSDIMKSRESLEHMELYKTGTISFGCRITTFPKWRSMKFVYHVLLCVCLLIHDSLSEKLTHSAIVNVTYVDTNKNWHTTLPSSMGRSSFGQNSKVAPVSGEIVHVRTKDNTSYGCSEYVNAIPSKKWIALVQRGGKDCTFQQKINLAARTYNASAVVIYNNETRNNGKPKTMQSSKKPDDVISIFIDLEDGLRLIQLIDKGNTVFMNIEVGRSTGEDPDSANNGHHDISRTSVLFVSISFIVLMIISLAWLVFYYIQRFRYAHAKERLTRRLASAAKKAISKIPQRTIKAGDKELECEFDQCAVCIEGYKTSEVIRILPCKHIFHKSCVDPWLLDQRSCPMCKLDILRAYGMQIHLNSSQESVHAEVESGATASAIADEPEHLHSSSEEHGSREAMNIVLIRHPSVQYHGSDTFSRKDESSSESSALNPQPVEVTADIEMDSGHSSDSENECNEFHYLMEET